MSEIYIGLLSGTSMDGIDVAAIDFSSDLPRIIAKVSFPYPEEFRNECLQITTNAQQISLPDFFQLDNWAGELFADAVIEFIKTSGIAKQDIIAIGSHGQTIWHAPNLPRPFTLQIGDPNMIAVKTGITTVADFRRADMAAGGQGAPFAPAFHQAVFASATEDRCIVNIGGISNISVLCNGAVTGFDTGPGNCFMDRWVQKHYKLDYDQSGEIAQTGTICEPLLEYCLQDPYFAKPAPKSTGREYFNDQWLQDKLAKYLPQDLKPQDVLATLLQLTATTISRAIQEAVPKAKVFVCGGGAYNTELMQTLSQLLQQNVATTQALGVDPSWVEATLFAWLAQRRINGKNVDLRSITGATKVVALGGVFMS